MAIPFMGYVHVSLELCRSRGSLIPAFMLLEEVRGTGYVVGAGGGRGKPAPGLMRGSKPPMGAERYGNALFSSPELIEDRGVDPKRRVYERYSCPCIDLESPSGTVLQFRRCGIVCARRAQPQGNNRSVLLKPVKVAYR